MTGYCWSTPRSLSVPGSPVNEDALAVSTSSLVMIDGASGLEAGRMTDWLSDAHWFAHALAPLLVERLADGEPIAVVLAGCLAELRTAYGEEDDGGLGPSASVLVARIAGDTVEVYSLGDCLALVGLADGTVDAVRDGTVGELDAAVVERLQEVRRGTALTPAEARPLVQDLLVGNRRLRNTPEGYWIADLSGAGTRHALIRTYAASDLLDVALMTDGFAAALDLADVVRTPGTFLQGLRQDGPGPTMDVLVARLGADADCTRYPRLKPMDDSSVVVAALHAGFGPKSQH